MMKRILSGVLLLCVLGLTGCGSQMPAPTPTPAATSSTVPTPAPTPTPEPAPTPDPVAEALAAMTTQEKVGQLLVAGIGETEAGEDGLQAVQDYQVGGVILFGRNVESAEQLASLTNELKALNGDNTPLFLCVDQEGGRVDRMPPEVKDTPSAYLVGQAGCASDYGAVLAAECAAFGCNVDFAPSLDIWSNPDNTVIGNRAFGTDPDTVTSAGLEALSAMTAGGVIPVVKHFPGHGDTREDSHVELPVVTDSLDTLRQEALAPFSAAIDATPGGLPAVMVSHILLTAVDDTYPATLSPTVVDGLLREDLGFDGVVFTDDMTMGAIADTWSLGEACVLAINAGCDCLLICHGSDNLTAARNALLAAVEEGRISQERLDESVYRILRLKNQYHLTNDPIPEVELSALNRQIGALWGQINQ